MRDLFVIWVVVMVLVYSVKEYCKIIIKRETEDKTKAIVDDAMREAWRQKYIKCYDPYTGEEVSVGKMLILWMTYGDE